MADEAIIELDETDDGTDATEIEGPVLTLLDAIAAPNLVPLLDPADVGRIGSDALSEFQIDWTSCEDFRKRYDRAMDSAMQVKKPKTFPWQNASNVCYPLLTTAAVQFQARAYPAIVDGVDVVKCRVLGPDPEGEKRDRADRVAAHMSWQFLNDVPGWEEDTDKLLLQLPIVGCVFRKTWHDPIRNQNNSETISAKDFVVHYDTVSLDKAPRFTHVQRYYPHEIEAFIRTGLWSRVPYTGDDGSDPHSLVDIYEQYRLIDMDDDGLPEPYVVTLTKDGAVARIVACFDMESIFIKSADLPAPVALSDLLQGDALPSDTTVVRIERKDYFSKYGFIPAPDGSFYDIGFGTLTDNLSAAVDTIINQLIDAGTLSNMQGGFIGGGTKIKSGNMRFAPGEWKRVEGVTAGPLRDNILPLQLPGPSPVLFQLLGMLIEAVKQITSVSDILTGNQEAQTAPTTALALIEQGQKVFTAIYQRIHRAFANDIKIMFSLNHDYLDEEQYFALDDNPNVVGKADYNDADLDVLPTSDPRGINDQVKMAKAQILMAHNGDPLVNQEEIRKREFEAAGIDNVKALLEVPPAPPPPDAIKAMADTDNETMKAKAEVRSKDAATAASLIQSAKGAYELGALIGDTAMIKFATEMFMDAQALASAVVTAMQGGENEQPAMQPGGVPALGGEPADAGLPPVPEGIPGPDGFPMGAGPRDVPEAAIAG